MDEAILKGIRVLDFTHVLAGPYATRILADFGAEVIKIQSKKTSSGPEANQTPYFTAWNRGKRSITLDMGKPEARALFLRLVEISDVVVENFSSRVMHNWGLTYERLKKVKGNLIMLSMSGTGQTGPWRNFTAFGPTLQSLTGMTYLSSFSKKAPMGLGFSYGDLISGLYGAFVLLAALEHRDRTGSGQYIDLSEYEAMCTIIGPTLMDAFVNQKEISPMGNDSESLFAAPHGCYPCLGTDRWCVISVFGEDEWTALCEVLGNPTWTRNRKFTSLSGRKAHKTVLDNRLEAWTKKRDAKDVVERLQKAGVCAGIVQNAEDLARDEQLQAREFFTDLIHPVLGKTRVDTFPVLFNGIRQKPRKPAPLLGEDNQFVFEDLLGLSPQKIAAYQEKGIIF